MVITHPWIKQIPGHDAGYGCMKITNKGKADDRLVGATIGSASGAQVTPVSTAGVAVRFEITGAIVIPAGQTIRLHAGSSPPARVSLASPLLEGSTVPGTLIFEKAGAIDIEYEIGD